MQDKIIREDYVKNITDDQHFKIIDEKVSENKEKEILTIVR